MINNYLFILFSFMTSFLYDVSENDTNISCNSLLFTSIITFFVSIPTLLLFSQLFISYMIIIMFVYDLLLIYKIIKKMILMEVETDLNAFVNTSIKKS
jgi:hypothetical protein